MPDDHGSAPLGSPPTARYRQLLARYRTPTWPRSLGQLLLTMSVFLSLWTLMWFSSHYSYWLTLGLALPTAGFLVRLFIIQHDCGHRAYFRSQRMNDLVGRLLSVLTLTPYQAWRRIHAIHHAGNGDLDRRGWGDVYTLTVREYLALSPLKRLGYRIFRNPLFMFSIGAFAYFFLLQRFTYSFPAPWAKERASVRWTNVCIVGCALAVSWLVGFPTFLLVHLPVICLGASAGVWLFYVQHNFEDTYWQPHGSWDFVAASVEGSSYYQLPKVLQWLTASIGLHHIHHLDSRIPNYRLQACMDENREFQHVHRVTVWSSLSTTSLKLWDEDQGKLVAFRHAARSKLSRAS